MCFALLRAISGKQFESLKLFLYSADLISIVVLYVRFKNGISVFSLASHRTLRIVLVVHQVVDVFKTEFCEYR